MHGGITINTLHIRTTCWIPSVRKIKTAIKIALNLIDLELYRTMQVLFTTDLKVKQS